jgi:hypothetical protein
VSLGIGVIVGKGVGVIDGVGVTVEVGVLLGVGGSVRVAVAAKTTTVGCGVLVESGMGVGVRVGASVGVTSGTDRLQAANAKVSTMTAIRLNIRAPRLSITALRSPKLIIDTPSPRAIDDCSSIGLRKKPFAVS